jgi:hypothetical protein
MLRIRARACFGQQASWIEHVLRPEIPLRPLIARVKLHAEKVPNFPKDTVLHDTKQLSVRITDPNVSAEQHWAINLETRPRERDVLEIGHTSASPASLIFPPDIHQIRAEHARLNSPV